MVAVPPFGTPTFNTRDQLVELFPNCAEPGSLDIESPIDQYYNCVAWSLGVTDFWLEPYFPMPAHPRPLWPDAAAAGRHIDVYVRMYLDEGFTRADDGSVEGGFHKVVLYWEPSSGDFTHVAKQRADGRWHSKLGMASDVVHSTPETLGPPNSPARYGEVWGHLKRADALADSDTPLKRRLREVEEYFRRAQR